MGQFEILPGRNGFHYSSDEAWKSLNFFVVLWESGMKEGNLVHEWKNQILNQFLNGRIQLNQTLAPWVTQWQRFHLWIKDPSRFRHEIHVTCTFKLTDWHINELYVIEMSYKSGPFQKCPWSYFITMLYWWWKKFSVCQANDFLSCCLRKILNAIKCDFWLPLME